MRRFWDWLVPESSNDGDPDAISVRVLRIVGTIAEESWFDDDITPGIFAAELNAGSGPVTIWLNSPGGDVVAAAQIYNMLVDYPGHITVNIDGIAASAASVIAMAASKVVMSPVSMLMIHNPATMAVGDKDELARAMSMLDSVKESIVNAYQLKTGMSRAKLGKLMDAETWMDARAAIDMGFADELLTGQRDSMVISQPVTGRDNDLGQAGSITGFSDDGQDLKRSMVSVKNEEGSGVVFSRRLTDQRLVAQLGSSSMSSVVRLSLPSQQPVVPRGRRVVDLYAQLINQSL